jgi:DNA-binding NtrC family response regulator
MPLGPRIYVVNYEAVIATSLTAILRMSGFNAQAFTNPMVALAQAQSESPDLLLSDVAMPHMSGIALAVQIQHECPNCKVLLFSGHAATSNLLLGAREEGHDFSLLSKRTHPSDHLRESSGATGVTFPQR